MATIVVNTNSWVTIAESETYLDEKLGADAWASLSDEEKTQSLISAFRWINRATNYSIGVVTDNLKYAQMELAFYIYEYSESHRKHEALIAQGVDSFRISKFWEASSGKIELPQTVKDLLSDYDLYTAGYFPLMEREVEQNG